MRNIINEYEDVQGNSPYADWLNGLVDNKAIAKIIIQVDRMELGLFGDSEPIGNGLSELRIHYGPGYRVYYGRTGENIYLLLCGGDKSSQKKDIKKAKVFWQDHKRRNQ
ncbi:type II toxin-antitoxin system RelE/ParE family toxin [Marinicella gelatinilytica]|uniref:type II toxin-antitoxin system RelE/ParE family toxin n=1 Tax=Marinicella gelatinilytica TaxID=2996017 RepID=UPI002260E43D|nr:type II toxin-antitoxin system RelE/ParE family toxin [Marinicella gelatinilytica]MCX7544490.1 type II toxin-antitoxin system RelE/ParE family toxin [Marinicella gelatinilytica]